MKYTFEIHIFFIIFILLGAPFTTGPCEAWGKEGKSAIEKSREYHGYYKWKEKESMWSVTFRKQKYPGEDVAVDLSEIHCYRFQSRLKTFTQTVERLPLTVQIFDGSNFRMWHNGQRDSDSSKLSFAQLQSLMDYTLDNFPLIALDPSNPLRVFGREQIDNRICEKIGVSLSRRLFSELPYKWFVIYVDTGTGEIKRMFAEIDMAEFQGMVQTVEFKRYMKTDGIVVPMQYAVFPASKRGAIIGPPLFEITKDKISFTKSVPETLFDHQTHKFLE